MDTALKLQEPRRRALYGIVALILFIETVEYIAPTGYIFSYLYAVPILIAANHFSERQTQWIIFLSLVSTILGLFVPTFELNSLTLVNRLIICSALWTVGTLSLRYRQAQREAQEQRFRVQSQQQLLRAYENFTAALTHDLKTPLQGMAQTLRFFAQGQFGRLTDAQRQVVQLFERSLGTLLELTDTLLTIYRNEREPLGLRCRSADLDALAAEVVTQWIDPAGARQVTLVYEGLAGAQVEADPLQLGRAITNLVANAVRYTRLASTVQVRLESHTAEYQIQVSDCGPGIPEGDLDRIFEQFYQSPLTRQSLGTGLGLYLSRQIVEAHSGRIWAVNNRDEGCTFVMALPKTDQGHD
ncbi:sensor histidine kinase [Gloeobacter morelensis]|uniref:histidine kinase n=1 Tax=Gloeobacter morelensis MG652769 TaxID=2781736 RepID=A0ABY3PQN0_9CYAN|nr:HAMP domain-containing sensor histidine kinase [Gloeobacter morelensis]UFP95914.1 HAMP domain-containing histidine kinase [Gloeobacter morelensis MG652769]